MSTLTRRSKPRWDPNEVPPLPVRRFTVEEYHDLIDKGVFDQNERFELLEGWIVPKMTKKPPHEVAVDLAQEELRPLLPKGWRLRVQSAVTTLESEPEPDVVVVRGSARDFVKRHPGPEQIGLVVEVADTSLTHDRTVKGRIYARAGIANYWIVNLIDRRIEVYSDPAPRARKPVYRARRDFGPGEAIPLSLGGRVIARVDVDALLP